MSSTAYFDFIIKIFNFNLSKLNRKLSQTKEWTKETKRIFPLLIIYSDKRFANFLEQYIEQTRIRSCCALTTRTLLAVWKKNWEVPFLFNCFWKRKISSGPPCDWPENLLVCQTNPDFLLLSLTRPITQKNAKLRTGQLTLGSVSSKSKQPMIKRAAIWFDFCD